MKYVMLNHILIVKKQHTDMAFFLKVMDIIDCVLFYMKKRQLKKTHKFWKLIRLLELKNLRPIYSLSYIYDYLWNANASILSCLGPSYD